MKRAAWCFAGLATFALTAAAQPKINALQNNYSYALPGTPSYGIAQGSIFIMYGSGMGPATLLAQGFNPSLSKNPAGVSIKITVGGTTTEAIPYYVRADVAAAILPSSTPVGDGTITVTYNNQTSATAPIHVVQSAFGILTMNGSGMGVAAVYDTDYHFITQTNAANPGQTVMFWGTGLGPDTRDETNLLTGVRDLTTPLEFYVGGKLASVSYHGRSSYPGLDQVNVVIPSGVSGCYVSVVAKTGSYVSNFATLPIATSGRTCSDTTQYSSADIQLISGKQAINVGTLSLGKTTSTSAPITVGGVTIPGGTTTRDSASGFFSRYTPFDFTAYGGLSNPSLGSCVVSTYNSTSFPAAPAQKILDAGNITLTLPDGSTKQLAYTAASGGYSLSGSSATPATPLFIPAGGGAFKFTGAGGADIGQFTSQLTVGAPLVWTNMSSISTIDRSQNLDVTWSGGAANSWVTISGLSLNTDPAMASFFTCIENVSAGHFTVPSLVLSSMLPNPTTGGLNIPLSTLSVGNYQSAGKFTATGLDIGTVSVYSTSSNSVTYK